VKAAAEGTAEIQEENYCTRAARVALVEKLALISMKPTNGRWK
jgi:hypothetical protein